MGRRPEAVFTGGDTPPDGRCNDSPQAQFACRQLAKFLKIDDQYLKQIGRRQIHAAVFSTAAGPGRAVQFVSIHIRRFDICPALP